MAFPVVAFPILHLLLFLLPAFPQIHAEERDFSPLKEPAVMAPERLSSGKDPAMQVRPLIGILSQPGDGDRGLLIKRMGWSSENVSYIAASYVKFVEMGGARAVPLIYNEPLDTLLLKFSAINGILFPGGSASLQDGPFYRTAQNLFKDHDVLERFSARRQPSTLLFKNDWSKQRNMFRWFPSRLIEMVGRDSLAMENHQFGISPENFTANEALSSFFRVLTTSPDKNNKVYVSTVEGRNYPVTGVQWHPEKNAFEWGLSSIPHSAEAIHVCQSVANFLVSELRNSNHTRSLEDEKKFLIYNYNPYYSGRDGDDHFEQSYVFVQS